MSLRTSDLLVHDFTLTSAQVLAGIKNAIGFVPPKMDVAGPEAEASCLELGLYFPAFIAHLLNECDFGRDGNAQNKNNFFGIGITGPGVQGCVFDTPQAGVRFAAAEYALKLRIPLKDFVNERASCPNKFDQVKALVDGGNFPEVKRISDLNKPFGNGDFVWMEDANGPQAIVEKAREVFPNLPDQGVTPMAMSWDKDLTNRNNGMLTDSDAVITIHNNGNSSSDRFDERAFVNGGGGSEGVMYHGALDSGGFMQIMPLDKQGVHAGNTTGNRTSIAFEMCEGSEPWDTVKENTSQLLAEIVTDSRGVLDYGTFSKDNFSLDRVVEHRDWAGANPNCPRRLIETDGGVERVVARARQIVAEMQPPDPTPDPIPEPPKPPKPTPLKLPKGMSTGVARRLFNPQNLKDSNGHALGFTMTSRLGKAWLLHVLDGNPKGKGQGDYHWPALESVTRRFGGNVVYQFSDGWLWEREGIEGE